MLSFHAKRGYSSWIYGVVLWAPQSPSVSHGYQDLYRVYSADTIGSTAEPYSSAVPMHLKAPHRTYLSKSQTWRKEADHTRGERGTAFPKLPPVAHDHWCTQPSPSSRFDCLEKMYRNCTLL
jgi:hypothetical protein